MDKNSVTILIVEDHPVAAMAAKSVFAKLGFSVDIAENGEQAITMHEQNNYSLIFMDIGLPGTNGYEVTRQIRLNESHHHADKYASIVALTAYASEKNERECVAAGINAILTKPLTQEKAAKILSEFIAYQEFSPSQTHVVPVSEEIVIQRKMIEQTLGDELAMMEEILDLLENSLAEESELFNLAYCNRDWTALAAITNKIKGSCDYAGAMRLKAACYALEDVLATTDDPQKLEDYCQNILTEMTVAREAIKRRNY